MKRTAKKTAEELTKPAFPYTVTDACVEGQHKWIAQLYHVVDMALIRLDKHKCQIKIQYAQIDRDTSSREVDIEIKYVGSTPADVISRVFADANQYIIPSELLMQAIVLVCLNTMDKMAFKREAVE